MKQRLNIQELEPNAYNAILEIYKYLETTTLSKKSKNLIKIRASQINTCAYCIEMHTVEALKNGEAQNRIFALSAWRESPLFSEEEKALLAATDEITQISNNGLTEETFQKLKSYFSDNEIAQIIIQIGEINIWNRIAVSTQMFHAISKVL
ncbi:carboxymuconolactone decarboxylase family protein [Tenacibaculum sp. 1B UA]|uniref:carboxymuconolactone decarboxylase family protein n=1 Tax=unclassified Tenacibaculum TaxID=2635139 RepID=UPI0026E39E9D|nr:MULTISPECIES: carboxymuconolactone decarboxylase family protein [unclassified Tenacibaculum]MDO6675466.1 carboxymuconolactone decarboxylase family protein [Tenacibaculum sp. 1_MG-2023]MDX8553143.1 carboxymuconolactone decarboxylase family protein [Tenacibaculum sp. 1B UA]